MKLLDGKKVAAERAEALRAKVAALGFTPKLAIVRVGERADSASYIKRKVEYGKTIGVEADVVAFPEGVSEAELVARIRELNADASVHGIIVQLPLPETMSAAAVIAAIDPGKDVDGLTAANIRALVANEEGIVPATARGIVALLRAYDVPLVGKRVVVVGRSLLVGKSTALHLINHDATVTVCHTKTADLAARTREADILIVAVGSAALIGSAHVHQGQVVIDVGISPLDEEIAGDVDFDAVKDMVAAISPVPGGVGPMTVLSLFENLLDQCGA